MLRSLVGEKTFSNGLAYAAKGAVLKAHWTPGLEAVEGEVWGHSPLPYRASVILRRSPTSRLVAIDGRCSCPVTFNCKHAVALLLAQSAAEEKEVPSAEWERSLAEVVHVGTEADAEADSPGLALGFEVVEERSRFGRSDTPGIRLVPLMGTKAGKWAKSGISWARLDYALGYGWDSSSLPFRQLGILKELRALGQLAAAQGRYYYSSPPDSVWLESLNSRRVWDLLRQATDLGLPLLSDARKQLPVRLHEEPAEAVLDAQRSAEGLHLLPRLRSGPEEIPLGEHIMLGTPPHGVAWRDPTEAGTPNLHLAQFGADFSPGSAVLLGKGPIEIPASDVERFSERYFPLLAREIVLESSDSSVELPSAPRPQLFLTVSHDEQRCELAWSAGFAGSTLRQELWSRGRSPVSSSELQDALAEATALLDGIPGLVDMTPLGRRIRARAQLAGMDAVRFSTEILPALGELEGLSVEQSGPAPQYRQAKGDVEVTLAGTAKHDWLDLDVAVSIDGEEVPFQELFRALAEAQSHMILPSGTYFSLDAPQLRQLSELIEEARRIHDAPEGQIRLSRFQASLWEDLRRLGNVVATQAEEWEASVRALSGQAPRPEHPVPASLQATLRPYQQDGFNWLASLHELGMGGILADDMGLGKTLQALALICHVYESNLDTRPFLVVAPTSVAGNWIEECHRFAPSLSSAAVTETRSRRSRSLAELAAGAQLVVTSYALFRLEYEAYAEIEWAGLFLDEAQFAKNPASQAFQTAKALPVPYKICMTGTPIENNLLDLWALFSISAPGLFARREGFTEHYRIPIERRGDAERLSQLRRRARPLMLRRAKEDVMSDLPEKQEQTIWLDLNPRHQKIYQIHLQRERQRVLGLLGDVNKHRFEILRSITLLRQACLSAALVDPAHAKVPSTKLDAMMEMLAEIVADGHRALVFSQFTRFLTMARERTKKAGIPHCYLDGRTTRRANVIDEFRKGKAPVFFISLKAGGFGLNLTEADYCFLLDPWWNPAVEAQAVDRIHRIGQTRNVVVYRLTAKDTMEEKVMALKEKKAALFENVVDKDTFSSSAISPEDIRALLT